MATHLSTKLVLTTVARSTTLPRLGALIRARRTMSPEARVMLELLLVKVMRLLPVSVAVKPDACRPAEAGSIGRVSIPLVKTQPPRKVVGTWLPLYLTAGGGL